MKEIHLTQGKVALVDDEDYGVLAQYGWSYKNKGPRSSGYAVRGEKVDGKYTLIKMHRVVLEVPCGCEVDHINGNGLDNRRKNLRIATKSNNQWNKGTPSHNNSGYKGVCWKNREQRWMSRITVNGKQIQLGYFKNKEEAAHAYNKAAIKYHGEFACLNKL